MQNSVVAAKYFEHIDTYWVKQKIGVVELRRVVCHIFYNESGHFCLFFSSTRKNKSVLHLISPVVVSTNCLVGENNDMSLGLHIYSQWHIQLCHFRHSMQTRYEIDLYPTCGQSAQDQQACLLCGPFKYKTSIRSTSQRQSFHKSFYSVAGRATTATFDALTASGVKIYGLFCLLFISMCLCSMAASASNLVCRLL